ncbi:MAG: response regulator transcription factor [Ruthenibacterium sp.]
MPLIYIVEDDANIREIEQFSLESAGYSTRVFTCAKDFYAALLEKAPALCLLDVMLPDEDGLTIVKKLRAGAATKHLPVLMVTAKTSELDKVKGLDGGADDYMTKPFGVMELISRVKALLRRAGGEEKLLSCGEVVMDETARRVTVGGEPCELTSRNMSVEIHAGQRVLCGEAILERVWGTDYEGESRTLDMHPNAAPKAGQRGRAHPHCAQRGLQL